MLYETAIFNLEKVTIKPLRDKKEIYAGKKCLMVQLICVVAARTCFIK